MSFKYRVADGNWKPVRNSEDNTVCFMMDDQGTDYVTFDTPDGKVEYQREEAE